MQKAKKITVMSKKESFRSTKGNPNHFILRQWDPQIMEGHLNGKNF